MRGLESRCPQLYNSSLQGPASLIKHGFSCYGLLYAGTSTESRNNSFSFFCFAWPTSSPGPFPRSKWRSEKPLANPRIVEYFVTWHMMKWLFRRLFPAYGHPLWFLQSEIVVQTKRSHFIVFTWQNSNEFLEPLLHPWPGISPTAILNEEKALDGLFLHAVLTDKMIKCGEIWKHSTHVDYSQSSCFLFNSCWRSVNIFINQFVT